MQRTTLGRQFASCVDAVANAAAGKSPLKMVEYEHSSAVSQLADIVAAALWSRARLMYAFFLVSKATP